MPAPVRSKRVGWNDVKAYAYRIYIQENKTLPTTMSMVEDKYGFKKSLRSWNYKLIEWGYPKNVPKIDMAYMAAKGKKRALDEDEDTEFFYKSVRVAPQKIENFKRRKTRDVVSCVATPPNITYNTPPDFPSEELSSEITPLHSILLQYLFEESQTWPQHNLYDKLDDQGLARCRKIIAEITELAIPLEEPNALGIHHSETQSLLPELCGVGAQFRADFESAIDYEQEESGALAALEHLFIQTTPLAIIQDEDRGVSAVTIMQELALATAFYNAGCLEEAEYHFRRILARETRIMAQLRLGVILAETFRMGEASTMMVSALFSFIVDFPFRSADDNFGIYSGIEFLLNELICRSESDWKPLLPCMNQMILTIQKSSSEGTTNLIFPQLFIHGLSFAREFVTLGMMDLAEHSYRVLLDHSFQVDDICHGIEMATAYQEYGLLLRCKQEWITSAENLLSACKCLMRSRTHDRRLNALLKSDYIDLLPHLADAPDGEGSIRENLRNIMAHSPQQKSPRLHDTLEAAHFARVEEFLYSDSPVYFPCLDTLDNSEVAQFRQPSVVPDAAYTEINRISTASMSCSSSDIKISLAYSNTTITGISDMMDIMVP